jgi:hypothetical protein
MYPACAGFDRPNSGKPEFGWVHHHLRKKMDCRVSMLRIGPAMTSEADVRHLLP